MTPWITLPQAGITVGQTGHDNDHDVIEAGLSTLWSAAQQSTFNVCHPTYGADPTGATDSTTAIQNAINAAQTAGGGVVYFPDGTYSVTPAGSTTAALVLNNGSAGYQGIRLVGATEQGVSIKRSAAGPILSLSGPASDTSGVTHCRYCSIENIALNGNLLTGTLVQTYYTDTCLFSNVHYVNSYGVGHDCAEFWDSRFINCLWDSCGSTTPSTGAPNLWLRNSAATSGFGYSSGTVNNIYLLGCRFEQPSTGAVRIERGLGTNIGQPYSLYFVASKFETVYVNGAPMFFCDVTARDIHVTDAHAYQGGFTSGYSTAQDVFTFGPQIGSLRDILVFNSSASACIANGVTVNSPLAGATVTIDNVRGSYTGGAVPTGTHIGIGTLTGTIALQDNGTDNGTLYPTWLPSTTARAILTASSTFIIEQNGELGWGPSASSIDADMARTGVGQLYFGANVVLSGTTSHTGLATFSGGTDTAPSAPVITPTFASGTAAQLSDTTRDYMVYFTVGTAGTITVAIGPTSTPANTLISAQTATAGELISFRLPAAWYVKVTLATATIAQKAIGC